ncbi:MAG: ROK family protein [Saprospiraceae bacterium]
MQAQEVYWGIDLGGTKIEGVVFTTVPDLKVLSRIRLPTEQNHGYDHILKQIKKIIELLEIESGLKASRIGIGTPGTIDSKTNTIKNSNTQCIIGKPMNTDLEKLLGVPVKMANDANCFAYAETRMGAVQELNFVPEVVFGIIMGTGVGGGIVVNNKIINGLHGIAGEWGHNQLDNFGELCYCGKKACVETFISGPSIEKYYKELTGKSLMANEIHDQSFLGDKASIQTMNRLIEYFGKAVAVVINILDPQVIVLGGGLSHLEILYTSGHDEVKKHLFNKDFNTQFLKPKLGDSAGVIGAGLL